MAKRLNLTLTHGAEYGFVSFDPGSSVGEALSGVLEARVRRRTRRCISSPSVLMLCVSHLCGAGEAGHQGHVRSVHCEGAVHVGAFRSLLPFRGGSGNALWRCFGAVFCVVTARPRAAAAQDQPDLPPLALDDDDDDVAGRWLAGGDGSGRRAAHPRERAQSSAAAASSAGEAARAARADRHVLEARLRRRVRAGSYAAAWVRHVTAAAGGSPHCLVFIGKTSFGPATRGIRRMPVKALEAALCRRHIVVRVDEYLTSQRCPRCYRRGTCASTGEGLQRRAGARSHAARRSHVARRRSFRRRHRACGVVADSTRIHCCLSCDLKYDKDRSAALHILTLGLALILAHERPAPFRRPLA